MVLLLNLRYKLQIMKQQKVIGGIDCPKMIEALVQGPGSKIGCV